MFVKRLLYISVITIFLLPQLCGCRKNFDKTGYVTALLDACYHGEYSEYSSFTGIATAQLSELQDGWLESETDRFLAMFGSLSPSQSTREDIKNMLRMIYASASYTVIDPMSESTDNTGDESEYPGIADSAEEKHVTVRLEPIMLIRNNTDGIKEYTDSFNQSNKEYKYYDLNSRQYADKYLEGILTLLQSHLSSIPLDKPLDINLSLQKGEDGLFSIPPDDLKLLRDSLLPGASYTPME